MRWMKECSEMMKVYYCNCKKVVCTQKEAMSVVAISEPLDILLVEFS